MHPDLAHLTHIDQLETLLAESNHRPLLLFKHSLSCGTSFEALDELIDHLNRRPAEAGHYASRGPAEAGHYASRGPAEAGHYASRGPLEAGHYASGHHPLARYAMVTVQTHRELSTAVATRLGVRHETPQALLVREGRVVWSASHFRVTGETLEAAIRLAVRRG